MKKSIKKLISLYLCLLTICWVLLTFIGCGQIESPENQKVIKP